jgi:hypothetical protein
MPTFEQVYTPVAESLVLSTLVAAIPIAVLFVLLAGFRVAATLTPSETPWLH